MDEQNLEIPHQIRKEAQTIQDIQSIFSLIIIDYCTIQSKAISNPYLNVFYKKDRQKQETSLILSAIANNQLAVLYRRTGQLDNFEVSSLYTLINDYAKKNFFKHTKPTSITFYGARRGYEEENEYDITPFLKKTHEMAKKKPDLQKLSFMTDEANV